MLQDEIVRGQLSSRISKYAIDDLDSEKIKPFEDVLQKQNLSIKRFIANEDAVLINKAVSGLGTDEEILAQLKLTSEACVAKYGKTLKQIVESEVSGLFGKMVLYALMDNDEYGSIIFDRATRGIGESPKSMRASSNILHHLCVDALYEITNRTDAVALIDLVNTRSNVELASIKSKWEALNKKGMVDCLESAFGQFSKHLRKVLMNQIFGLKDETDVIDVELAKDQAVQLYKAGKGRIGKDETVFIQILTTQNRMQIQEIMKQYEAAYNTSLKQSIKSKMSGDFATALKALLYPNMSSYIAYALRKAFSGMGTDMDRICRLLGGTNKRILSEVNENYLSVYGKTLKEAIKSEALISGDFRKALLSWVSGFDPTNSFEYVVPVLDQRLNLKTKLKEHEGLKNYIARRDAYYIRKACQGIGTDNNALISAICSRSKEHLARVDLFYHKLHGKSLIDEVKQETRGHFRKLLIAVIQPYDEFDAYVMKKACDGIGTNEKVIIECLAPRSNDRIAAMKAKYDAKNERPLVDRLGDELTGKFKMLILELLKGQRNEDAPVDLRLAIEQAEKLHSLGAAQWGTNEEVYIDILVKSSRMQIQEIKKQYQRLYNEPVRTVIAKETSGDFEHTLVALLYEPHEYFSKALDAAFRGFGTDEDLVTRILGSHDKSDLTIIADTYFSTYGCTLASTLKSELSGNFRSAALMWVEQPDPLDLTPLKEALLSHKRLLKPNSKAESMNQTDTIEMRKGEIATISPGLTDVISVGLQWESNSSVSVDLDLGVQMYDQYGGIRDAVFYGKKEAPGVSHSGDSKDGIKSGQDESLCIQLSLLPEHIHYLVFTVYCYQEDKSFADVHSSSVKVLLPLTGHVCSVFSLDSDIRANGVAFAMMSKSPNGWKYITLGKPIGGSSATHPDSILSVKHIIKDAGVEVMNNCC